MIRLTLALILCASTAHAEGGCWDDCEPPAPPPAVTPQLPDGDSEYTPGPRIFYAQCTCTEFRTAWGFETKAFREEMARSQCMMLRHKRQCEVTDQAYEGVLK
jgi:hypothetical protein